MKNLILVMFWVSVAVFSCDDATPETLPPPPVSMQDTLPKTIPVEFINPFSENLEVRVFDDRGWVVKVEVPGKGRQVENVPLGLYTIGVKNPIQGEYIHFYPSGVHSDSISDPENLGIKENAKGERDVRFKFREVIFENGVSSRLIFDMGLNPDHRYALGNARKYYLSTEPISVDSVNTIQDSIEQKVVLATYAADKPFYIPITSLNPNDPLPDEVILADVVREGVFKLYVIPDSIPQDSIEGHVTSEILFEALVKMVQEGE